MVYNLTPILCSRHVKTMDLSSVEECLYSIPMALGNSVGLPTYLFSCPSESTNHRSRFALPTHFDILSMLSSQVFMSYRDHISSLIPDFYGLVTITQIPMASLFYSSSREMEVFVRYFLPLTWSPLKSLLIVPSIVSYPYLRFWHK